MLNAVMEQQQLLYFAYGSMCNPVSLSRRGLFPTASCPAVLSDYQMTFQLGGMANISAAPGSSCNGMVHCITQQEFAVLKEIEGSYETLQVPVTPYKPCNTDGSATAPATPAGSTAATRTSAAPHGLVPGSPITATAFIVPPSALAAMAAQHPEWGSKQALPSDRYLRIITAGLQHFGADPDWIAWVAAQPCKHGRQPYEYLKIPAPSPEHNHSLPTYTPQQLLSLHADHQQDNKAFFAIGPKVVALDFSSKPDAPMTNIIKKHYVGH